MRSCGLTTKAGRLAIFLLAAAFCLPAFAGVLYVPVSPTVVAQTEDHYRLRRYVAEAPFGNFRTTSHPGGDCGGSENTLTCQASYTYTGHLYDQESGLFYFGARYYDPETGRFLSQDPVAGDALNPPSLHKYLYCYSNPMNNTDAWGELADGSDPRMQGQKYVEGKGWIPKTPQDEHRQAEEQHEILSQLGSFAAGFVPGLETVQDIVGVLGYDVVTWEKLSPTDRVISAGALLIPIGGGIIRGPKRAVKGVEHAIQEGVQEARKGERLAKEAVESVPAQVEGQTIGGIIHEGGEAKSLVEGAEAPRAPQIPTAEPPRRAPNGPSTEIVGKDNPIIQGSGGSGKVYEIPGSELKSGKPYIGKTKRPVPTRMADKDHRVKTPTGQPPQARVLAENLNELETAGMESTLARERGMENLSNKIPPLNPALPKNAPKIEAAKRLLEKHRELEEMP